ncbi:MAG: N-formylglutamate amidohydrolase [Polyangiaceae bacterium]
MQHAHFEVVRALDPGPVVVEIPHAGLTIDEASARFTTVPVDVERRGAREADADFGADLVWLGSEAWGITRIVARTHRYVIDLNTNPRPPPQPPFYEEDPEPRPIIRRSAAGVSWREPALPRHEVARRVDEIFEPYHAAVDVELTRSRARYGRVVLLASHTFPASAATKADAVLGTQEGRTLEPELREAIADVLRAAGLAVALEAPFPGGHSLTRHARIEAGVFAVQLELARRLVADPSGVDHLRGVTQAMVGVIRERITIR